MSWSPQINFRLRDDQVSLGNLILDKNGAEQVAKMLMDIKNGNVPDLGLLKETLEMYCYTDEEFIKIKDEMDAIKQDIKDFKAIGSNALQRWNISAQMVNVNAGYLIGSETWIEKYLEIKQIAADMYDKIVACGYEFDSVKKKVYEERYRDILGHTTSMDRVGSVFERQYKEAVLNDDPNALEDLCRNMVDAGVWTEKTAENERIRRQRNQLLNKAEGAINYKEKMRREQEEQERREQKQREREERIANAKQNQDTYVEITCQLIESLNQCISQASEKYGNVDAFYVALEICVDILKLVDKENDLLVNVPESDDLNAQYRLLYEYYTMGNQRGLVDAACQVYPTSKIDKVRNVVDLCEKELTQSGTEQNDSTPVNMEYESYMNSTEIFADIKFPDMSGLQKYTMLLSELSEMFELITSSQNIEYSSGTELYKNLLGCAHLIMHDCIWHTLKVSIADTCNLIGHFGDNDPHDCIRINGFLYVIPGGNDDFKQFINKLMELSSVVGSNITAESMLAIYKDFMTYIAKGYYKHSSWDINNSTYSSLAICKRNIKSLQEELMKQASRVPHAQPRSNDRIPITGSMLLDLNQQIKDISLGRQDTMLYAVLAPIIFDICEYIIAYIQTNYPDNLVDGNWQRYVNNVNAVHNSEIDPVPDAFDSAVNAVIDNVEFFDYLNVQVKEHLWNSAVNSINRFSQSSEQIKPVNKVQDMPAPVGFQIKPDIIDVPANRQLNDGNTFVIM